MKKVSTDNELKYIIDYIRPNKGRCMYLYIDISVYGVNNDFLDLWYDEDEKGISLVIMRYHDSLQIYSEREEWDKEALSNIVKEYDIKIINGLYTMLEAFMIHTSEEYSIHKTWAFKGAESKRLNLGLDVEVEIGRPEDTNEIAELMCTSTVWSSIYEKDTLAKQLKERMLSKMGRSFIIRDNGRIVAHDGTFAETDDMVVCSGLIVKEEFVDKMYGAALSMKMDDVFRAENKEKYFFLSDVQRKKIFERLGNIMIAETGKLVKKQVI